MILRDKEEELLFGQLAKYNTFPELCRKKILFVSIKNLMYTISNKNVKKVEYLLENFWNMPYSLVDISRKVEKALNITLKRYTIQSFEELKASVRKIGNNGDPVKAIELNLNLASSGICPLILFAFNKWQTGDAASLNEILELTLVYMYRYVPISFKEPEGYKKINTNGSTSDVYIDFSGNRICKVAKNYITKFYLLEQEYKNVMICSQEELSRFLPGSYEYDRENGWLFHDAVIGECAEEMLFNGLISDAAIEQLSLFYKAYIDRSNKNRILDIHPGNFIWDKKTGKLILVDVGSIPKIGSEFYAHSSFEEYYKKVWKNRASDIQKYPIRSLDLSIRSQLEKNYGVGVIE